MRFTRTFSVGKIKAKELKNGQCKSSKARMGLTIYIFDFSQTIGHELV